MPVAVHPIRENIKGSELPENLRRKAKIAPGEVVTITIQPKMDDALENMLNILDRAGKEAEKRGLTDDILSDLLKDES